MRELKFRAWDKMNQKLIKSPMAISSGEGGWVLFTSEINNLDCQQAIHDIRGYEIMQYIGHTDQDGLEIYEGDILEIEGVTAIVVFWERPPEFGLDYSHSESEWCEDWNINDDSDRMKIVGNIHENPEMLSTG